MYNQSTRFRKICSKFTDVLVLRVAVNGIKLLRRMRKRMAASMHATFTPVYPPGVCLLLYRKTR